MDPAALIMMVLILGGIWGGFVGLLWYAVRREGRKASGD